MKKRLYLLGNLLVVGAILLIGCSSEVMLGEADKEIILTASEEYGSLKETMSPDEAREALVEKLTTEYEGIESAVLGEDGYTIFIEFSDGDFAGIDTFDQSELSTQPSGYNYYPEHLLMPRIPQQSVSEETEEKIIPQTNKVLILCPECYRGENVVKDPQEFVNYFKEFGWTDEDIVVKKTTTASSGEMVPEDLFNLGEYGIILFFAHGTVENADEGEIFIQCCNADDALFQNNPQYGEWKEQKKLIIVHSTLGNNFRLDIRLDLLTEKMDTLPSSYVHLATCYGGYFFKLFCEKGAKTFLGWDRPILWSTAGENQLDMLKLMLNNNYYALWAYSDDTIVRTWENDHGSILAQFLIYPDDVKYFYLPAWVNLTVTGIPEGTSFIRTSVYDKDSNLLAEDDKEVLYGATQLQIEEVGGLMLAPTEEVRVEAQAFDSSNQELDSGQATTTLNAGANLLQVHLTSESVTAETRGEVWGPYTYQEGDVWKATAGGDVFAVWKGEDRTYTAIFYKPGEDPRNRTYSSESVYTKEEVMARFFGENVWKLADDEVAVGFSSWSYTGLPGGTEQQALDNFYRTHGNWEEEIQNSWQSYLLWRLEITG